MKKNIDFDLVADLYDVYVDTDYDVRFWKEEASSKGGSVLELMCGTGRIGLSLLAEGVAYTGLDYSRKLLDRFQEKIPPPYEGTELVHADAREFQLERLFDLVFIGFHSLSEVLVNGDKLKVLQRIQRHLKPVGIFSFSLHNPAARNPGLTGEKSKPQILKLKNNRDRLEFSYQFNPPSSDGIVTGRQFYTIRDQEGHILNERKLDLQFHLIPKEEMESLLEEAGFRIESTWGGYDRSSFEPTSPHIIYRCVQSR